MEAQVASQKPASRRRGYCLQDRNGRNINFDQNWGLIISQKLKAWKQSYHLFKWAERCVSAAKWLVMPVPASSHLLSRIFQFHMNSVFNSSYILRSCSIDSLSLGNYILPWQKNESIE